MADVLTLVYQLLLIGLVFSVLTGMVRESWRARTPGVGRRHEPVRSAAVQRANRRTRAVQRRWSY
jgi:hypothetical protein